jgi:hypothetical protein
MVIKKPNGLELNELVLLIIQFLILHRKVAICICFALTIMVTESKIVSLT